MRIDTGATRALVCLRDRSRSQLDVHVLLLRPHYAGVFLRAKTESGIALTHPQRSCRGGFSSFQG